jgi:hypothetical protein
MLIVFLSDVFVGSFCFAIYQEIFRDNKVDRVWNVMAHTQKPDFVFRRNGQVHLNRRGRQFSRLLAAEVCASAVVMLDTPFSEVVWRVLATHSIRQFPLHIPIPCVTVCHHISTGIYRSISAWRSKNLRKVKVSHNRPGQALRSPGGGDCQNM